MNMTELALSFFFIDNRQYMLIYDKICMADKRTVAKQMNIYIFLVKCRLAK